jgi:hypothetical protein
MRGKSIAKWIALMVLLGLSGWMIYSGSTTKYKRLIDRVIRANITYNNDYTCILNGAEVDINTIDFKLYDFYVDNKNKVIYLK